MNSTLPYSNRLLYLIGEKTGCDPEALRLDVEHSLRDYAAEVNATALKERDEWYDYAMRRMDGCTRKSSRYSPNVKNRRTKTSPHE